ncbi:MAG: hypothetical protein ACI808_001277 [Paraglaciecola sp.]|jgi:hypothetical protein
MISKAKGERMNAFMKLPFVVVMTSLVLLCANIAFWSAAVFLLTVLAVPGFIIWVIGAYILSYLTISTSEIIRMATYLFPKLPSKPKRLRIR